MQSSDQEERANYWRKRALLAEFSRKHEVPPVLHLETEMAALRTRLNAMENSRSWKLTAPLRSITEWLINMRRKSPSRFVTPQIAEGQIESRIEQLQQYAVSEDIAKWTDLMAARDEGST